MTDPGAFLSLVDRATKGKHPALMPVIRKELLHLDFLWAMKSIGAFRHVVFQGGTALRLCYAGVRFSEDLDFSGGVDFDPALLDALPDAVSARLGGRYGLHCHFRLPRRSARVAKTSQVFSWRFSIDVTPGRPDLRHERVCIQVANVPAYSRKVLPAVMQHAYMPDGMHRIMAPVEDISEIASDKIVSFASAPHVRHRDIWDLTWIAQMGVRPDVDLVQNKIADYGVTGFRDMVQKRVLALPEYLSSDIFAEQMARFLDVDDLKWAISSDGRSEMHRHVRNMYSDWLDGYRADQQHALPQSPSSSSPCTNRSTSPLPRT